MSAGTLLMQGQPGFFPHEINLLAGLLRRHLALTGAPGAGLFWKRLIIFKNKGLMILPWCFALLIPLASLRSCVHFGVCVCVCVCVCARVGPRAGQCHAGVLELKKAGGLGGQVACEGRPGCLGNYSSAVYTVTTTRIKRQLSIE